MHGAAPCNAVVPLPVEDAAAVRQLVAGWPEAQREAFEERAAIVQHLGALPRDEAEVEALDQVLDEEVAAIRAAWAAEGAVV